MCWTDLTIGVRMLLPDRRVTEMSQPRPDPSENVLLCCAGEVAGDAARGSMGEAAREPAEAAPDDEVAPRPELVGSLVGSGCCFG
jgi:hypothetical protein